MLARHGLEEDVQSRVGQQVDICNQNIVTLACFQETLLEALGLGLETLAWLGGELLTVLCIQSAGAICVEVVNGLTFWRSLP